MPTIRLLQTRKVEYKDNDDLKRLIKRHKDQLGVQVMNLERSGTIARIQAIAYNLIHLSRELERRGGKKAQLHVRPGGKED